MFIFVTFRVVNNENSYENRMIMFLARTFENDATTFGAVAFGKMALRRM